MSKETKKLKVLVRFLDVTMIMVLVVYGFIIIKNIDIAKGHIGQQEVAVIRVFDNLLVMDNEYNRKYWQNVEDFFFKQDALIIKKVNTEEASNITNRVYRREMNLKTSNGQQMKMLYDFSKLTLELENGKKKTYDNVKSVVVDRRQEFDILNIVYFNDNVESIHGIQ